MPDPMRDYLEQRERKLEERVAALEEILGQINVTLVMHGHVDANTPLHERIAKALEPQ